MDAGILQTTPRKAVPRRPSQSLALEILGLLWPYRRVAPKSRACGQLLCTTCVAPHLARLTKAIEREAPILFVLPAFPGKSPNPAKVLGPRPDMAERQSLAFLNELCHRIQDAYAPGARILLCSDGRVFSDVVGLAETDITTYQQDLRTLIAQLPTPALSTFHLDDVFPHQGFDDMREGLMVHHGQPLETLQTAVREGGDAALLYCGITRFLLEDATLPGMTLSRTALQKDCRRRAYEVILRSQAWDALLAAEFPEALRLSIHPQGCGSRKLGIHLMKTADEWLTPWHGVAVQREGRFTLLKRSQAEALGATLVFENERPSHYALNP